MKLTHLLLVLMALGAASMQSHAEIYKWKDKDGKTRYSDTPPPSNIKQEAIGSKKAVQPTGQAPLAPVESAQETPVKLKDNVPPPNTEDAAAQKRQRDAEMDKKNKQEKELEAKRKAENCSGAKANLETYTQGGRVYKMNERGEREYMDEKDFKAGKEKAQQEISENC
jgi:Skp family chaperone for outer membrane proteins